MQADIEIQSAAKLPTRQVRRSGGTGARSGLESGLAARSASSGAVPGMRAHIVPEARAAGNPKAQTVVRPGAIPAKTAQPDRHLRPWKIAPEEICFRDVEETLGPVLVATDFSAEADRALKYAAALLKTFRGTLHLVHVHEVDYGYAMPGVATVPPLIPFDEIERLDGMRLRELATSHAPPGTEIEVHLKMGRAFDQICALAQKIDARLLVISTQGRTGLRRMLMGSTAERIVQHSPCPVLVVRAGEREFVDLGGAAKEKSTGPLPMKILVPVDFSACSQAGLDHAIWFARTWQARLILFHAVHLPPFLMEEPYAAYDCAPPIATLEQAAQGQMRDLRAATSFGEVPCETQIHVGDAAQQICRYADEQNINLIITATHGHTGLSHVLIGSVAEHVVRYAHCPVLVVPRRIRIE